MKQFKTKIIAGLIVSLVGISAFGQTSGYTSKITPVGALSGNSGVDSFTTQSNTSYSPGSGVGTQTSVMNQINSPSVMSQGNSPSVVSNLLSSGSTSSTGVGTQSSSSNSASGVSGIGSPTIPGLPPLWTQPIDNLGLKALGCDPLVMQNLNSIYLNNRSIARAQQYSNEMNTMVATTPKANTMDCFQQAMQTIDNLMKAVNAVMALMSGNIDMKALMSQIANMVLNAACQEVNAVTGNLTSSLNTYNGTINQTVGAVNNLQIGVGGQSTSVFNQNGATVVPLDVFNGSVNGINNTIGGVNSTLGTATNTGTALANKITSVNPFGGK